MISLALSLALASSGFSILLKNNSLMMAEGVGFEPTLGLLLSLISSQVPSTTQPPFRFIINNLQLIHALDFCHCTPPLHPATIKNAQNRCSGITETIDFIVG